MAGLRSGPVWGLQPVRRRTGAAVGRTVGVWKECWRWGGVGAAQMAVADLVNNLGGRNHQKVVEAAEELGAMVSIKDLGPDKAGAQLTRLTLSVLVVVV